MCIIGPVEDKDLPCGADSPLRRGAIDAAEEAGIKVEDCWSGWGVNEKKFQKLMKIWNEEDKEYWLNEAKRLAYAYGIYNIKSVWYIIHNGDTKLAEYNPFTDKCTEILYF